MIRKDHAMQKGSQQGEREGARGSKSTTRAQPSATIDVYIYSKQYPHFVNISIALLKVKHTAAEMLPIDYGRYRRSTLTTIA